MAEQNQDMQAISQVLSSVMAQMKQMQAAPAAVPTAAVVNNTPAVQSFGGPALTGWSVPVEQEINGMTVTLYLNFPADTFAQASSIIMTLVNQGFQVRAFQRNNGGFGNSNGFGNRGGGYGGGYNRGGYGKRW